MASNATLDRLARPSGAFGMVALDQRESLRTMMATDPADPDVTPEEVADERLTGFKLAAARALGPHASALLIDRRYGYRQVVERRILPDGCGLILAMDALDQEPGQPVLDTDLDPAVDPHAAAGAGVAALKLLLLWRPDARRSRRLAIAERFVAACAAAGLPSVLEGVVRPDTPDQDELNEQIVTAATELGALRPSLYKAQVPGLGLADDATTGRVCARITRRVPVPWVVLSQGVPLSAFPHAVEIACRSGASGFLAGRAVWSDVVREPDHARALRERSVPRLRALAATVDRYARPWREALA
ncbi:MAG: hypothetical protein WCA46_27080 [Actinocatenispora sp.]